MTSYKLTKNEIIGIRISLSILTYKLHWYHYENGLKHNNMVSSNYVPSVFICDN